MNRAACKIAPLPVPQKFSIPARELLTASLDVMRAWWWGEDPIILFEDSGCAIL